MDHDASPFHAVEQRVNRTTVEVFSVPLGDFNRLARLQAVPASSAEKVNKCLRYAASALARQGSPRSLVRNELYCYFETLDLSVRPETLRVG